MYVQARSTHGNQNTRKHQSIGFILFYFTGPKLLLLEVLRRFPDLPDVDTLWTQWDNPVVSRHYPTQGFWSGKRSRSLYRKYPETQTLSHGNPDLTITGLERPMQVVLERLGAREDPP
jgi:hypothetical protein